MIEYNMKNEKCPENKKCKRVPVTPTTLGLQIHCPDSLLHDSVPSASHSHAMRKNYNFSADF